MRIEDVIIWKVTGTFGGELFPPGDRQSQQLDVYTEFNSRSGLGAAEPGKPIQALYVEIASDEGLSGWFGPIQEIQAFLIQKFLRPYLRGRDPLATELLFDQMVRMDRHGRSGMFMMGVSVVDCALWDLKGKAWGQPIYRLLGGPTRAGVPAYASMLGYSVEPEKAAAVAEQFKGKGYSAQKWFFRYGPGDGDAGKARNLAMARAVREAIGPDYSLMFDAFMGWSLAYAMEMVKALAPLHPFWMEEPVPPERVGALRRLRRASSVPIATGEHVYTRWQTKELLVHEAADFLQNDPDWTGGISELTRICGLASAFDTPVIAHGHSLLAALHVAGAQSPTTVPFVEFLIRHQDSKQWFQKTIYRPEQGMVKLPDLPGLGLELSEEKLESKERVGEMGVG
jgi:L-alanine-DL-glutamate epimerase-like enolase superfamily enzyme